MSPLAFGDFVLDPGARLLTRQGTPVHLTAKATDLLLLLASRRGEAISKKEIHDRLWPDTFVSDVSLTTLVFELRTALGESARHPRFLHTRHGFGYMLQLDGPEPAAAAATPFRIIYDGREVVLQPGENLLGRSRDCRLRIDSTRVSRHHARIIVDGGAAFIEDCGSRNGTWVRGERVDGRLSLRDGDDIGLASVRAVFRILSDLHGTGATE